MEHKSLWKNFILLTVSGLIALHLNVSHANDGTDKTTSSTESSEECILEIE